MTCKIWVLEEDQIQQAIQFFEAFQQNPDDPRFYGHSAIPPLQSTDEIKQPPFQETSSFPAAKTISWESQPLGLITLYLVITCAWLFIWGMTTTPPQPSPVPTNISLTPLLEPPINKILIYDYPYAYELVDKLVATYGLEKLESPNELPPAGLYLFDEYLHTTYWQGLYAEFFKTPTNPGNPEKVYYFNAPMFEKIREGEIWRLFTPALLHANIIHILFNMIWLVVLGKQLESRLGGGRYLLFVLITGVFSNTAQYIMSGANFIGISGVLCAMFAFIWMRQRYAAWEGYHLQPGTIAFLGFFIGAMLAIQIVSFVMELYWHVSISPGIANTAHFSGVLSGLILGRMKFFAWNPIK